MNEVPKLVIDVNSLSADGSIAILEWMVSPNGNFIAYSVSVSDSDWTEIRIRNIKTGKDYSECLKHVKFTNAWSSTWTHDNKGFFYSVS